MPDQPKPTETQDAATARARAAATLAVGTEHAGFTVTSREEIAELDADAYVLHHRASGARLLYLACEDDNKAFAIAFKTPPTDSTGVFHILEHSVLCGSQKFPVKEPFVDLIKSSMQTFLNAMTYPDKTVYPVATTNERDLLNLMDVYMDAVLNPAIYTKPAIFQQEGWHYELDVPEGGNLRDGGLRVNGVVFNEMKGALSDPSSVLDDAVNGALFPGSAYAHESGGDPKVIPTLTYEHFLDTHARHYNLANSYITLYGDIHVERELEFLDERYLSDAAREAAAARKAAAADGAAAVALAETQGPNPLTVPEQPEGCARATVEMQTTPENAQVGMAYILGDAQDRKRVVAADILFEALLGSNEAPVKKALLAAGLGGDVADYTSDACLRPYELIILRSAREGAAADVRRVIEDTCRGLVDTGIPRDRLEAVISGNEYDLRQRDYGTADGVVLACDALSTWLYEDTDEAATRALKYAGIYAELRAELSGSYFEDLLREIVLDHPHAALVELKPIEGAPAAAGGVADASSEEALAAVRGAMSDEELRGVVDTVAELRAHQEAEDTPEAKATLPRLRVSDIGAGPAEPALTVDATAPIPCLKHAIPTRKLAYAIAYFDLTHVSYTELPYVSVLAQLMQQLPTAQRSAAELDSYIGSNLGFLSFRCEVMGQPDWRLARPVLSVAAGALSEKVGALASIPREVWAETLFEDTDRIRDVLTQARIAMEQGFLMAGHQAALSRAWSYVSPAGVAAQQFSGVDFYRFLRELLDNFDERKQALCDKLRELQGRIFTSDGTVVSFTGSDEDYRRFWDAAGTLGLTPRTHPAKELYVPMPEPRHEAFVIPSDICFAARALDPRRAGIETDGTWAVAANALSYDYLWNEIRVKGGAYGCGFRVVDKRQLAFYTYRDPAIDPSQERIAAAGAWLSEFDPEPEVFGGFIVSCVSAQDAPVKPYALARRQDAEYFTKRPVRWREGLRGQILAATPEKLRALGEDVARAAAEAPLCVFGGRDVIERSHAGLTAIDLMA